MGGNFVELGIGVAEGFAAPRKTSRELAAPPGSSSRCRRPSQVRPRGGAGCGWSKNRGWGGTPPTIRRPLPARRQRAKRDPSARKHVRNRPPGPVRGGSNTPGAGETSGLAVCRFFKKRAPTSTCRLSAPGGGPCFRDSAERAQRSFVTPGHGQVANSATKEAFSVRQPRARPPPSAVRLEAGGPANPAGPHPGNGSAPARRIERFRFRTAAARSLRTRRAAK